MGVIHYELAKYLFKEGFNCVFLPWQHTYSPEEIHAIDESTDLWVTPPCAVNSLYNLYKILPEKCVAISHSTWDNNTFESYLVHRVYKFGAVSNFIIDHARDIGLTRIPELCPIAINYSSYYAPPTNELKIVGFAGAYHSREEHEALVKQNAQFHLGTLKRGHLVKECAEKAGLQFKYSFNVNKNFMSMPGYYKSVDCVICASTEESGPLPVMEAGAAGKLVIGTPVGHWPDKITSKGGIEVPINEKEFVDRTIETLTFYKNNPKEYREKCKQIQLHSKTYDWSVVIENWISILS